MSLAKEAELRFEPPGPGSWELDPVHFPRPSTRYMAETQPEPFRRGVQDFTRFYGMLIDGLEYRFVNGFAYKTVHPVAPEEIPVRFQRAAEVFEKKLWREQLKEWDEKVKPASIEAHRALQAVDPDALSDEELIAYLTRCRRHHVQMTAQHLRHTAAAVVPTGDFLSHVGEWTKLPPAELLDLMRGASPVSSGASAQLTRLTAAMATDSRARELLASKDDPAHVFEALRSLDREAGTAMRAYLDLVGNRLIDGFDISEPTALELPDVLLRAIRVAVEGRHETSDLEQRIAAVRAKVPEAHRTEFDELLGEARLMYRLRDERGVFSDIWAAGLMRRAALAGGRRLAEKGRIRDAKHFVDASFDEMCALLRDAAEPSADELAARAEYRATHKAKDAPATLGPPPPPPPDMSGLPPAVARMMQAIGIALHALFAGSEAPNKQGATLRGLAASRGVYEGPARRVSSPAEFDRILKGDVLVTESTTEAFNILLPLLGGIVTDSGGLLSHSAIVAREYGIPGVVGTREASSRIADGTRVRVDGNAGEVTVLA